MYLTNIGTTNGTRRYFIDGLQQVTRSGIDWSSIQVKSVQVGESWSDVPTFTGTLDYDDVRLTTTSRRAASWCRLPPPLKWETAKVDPSLRSSGGSTAHPAPYAFDAAFSVSGAAGSFFSDAACQTPNGAASLIASGTSAVVYFRPTSGGSAELSASYADFLEGTATLSVSGVGMPDGGAASDGGALADAGMTSPDAGAPANVPVAVISPQSQTVGTQDTATLDGTRSTAPAGTFVATWSWRQVQGPAFAELPAPRRWTCVRRSRGPMSSSFA